MGGWVNEQLVRALAMKKKRGFRTDHKPGATNGLSGVKKDFRGDGVDGENSPSVIENGRGGRSSSPPFRHHRNKQREFGFGPSPLFLQNRCRESDTLRGHARSKVARKRVLDF